MTINALKLIVGLGNPGEEYRQTRHNVGFDLIDDIASELRLSWQNKPKFFSDLALSDAYTLQKPITYMNRSGQAVAAFAQFYKIPPEAILVLHDDLDLPPGAIRLKTGGGAGGHNGLKNIDQSLGTPNYHRLRIGIGHPGVRSDVLGFVLGLPSSADREAYRQSFAQVLASLPDLLAGDFPKLMRLWHSSKK